MANGALGGSIFASCALLAGMVLAQARTRRVPLPVPLGAIAQAARSQLTARVHVLRAVMAWAAPRQLTATGAALLGAMVASPLPRATAMARVLLGATARPARVTV